MSKQERIEPKKQLRICSKCSGYMQPQSAFATDVRSRNWKDETRQRSFGGLQIRKFVCEKCKHVEVFQVDRWDSLLEDKSDDPGETPDGEGPNK